MRKVFFCLIIFIFTLSCSTSKEKNSFCIVTWNSYLFFDSRDDGNEYAPFKKNLGFSDSIYQKRVKATAMMMAREFSDADVILLQEIESNVVLLDLLDAGLKKKGFCYYGIAYDSNSVINVGYISKIKPSGISVHGTDGCRKQLQLTFLVNGEEINVLVLHARSRLDDMESVRYEEFSIARSVMDAHPDSVFVVAGDFNADPTEKEAGMSNIELVDNFDIPLILTGDRGESRDGIFFTPALDYGESVGDGTYFHDGKWSWLDNFIFNKASFDSKGWEYCYCKILRPDEFVSVTGFPTAFDVSTAKGMSDHLPLMSVLVYN